MSRDAQRLWRILRASVSPGVVALCVLAIVLSSIASCVLFMSDPRGYAP